MPPTQGTNEACIRVLAIDDHPVFLEGLVLSLRRQPDIKVVGQAADGEDAISLWGKQRPDVTLLDLEMWGLNGMETLRRLRWLHPGARVLMLTASERREDIVAALEAGAAGYVTKHARYDEIVAAIRRVHSGQKPLDTIATRHLAVETPSGPLTPREMEVLLLLKNGLTYADIGSRLSIGERTVRTHVVKIQGKLGAANNAQAIARAFELGHLRPLAPPPG
jgi:DNA-binding NarL/FixJ family response regulator